MRKAMAGLAMLFCLSVIASVSAGQSTNASVAGFVQDVTQAFIPGATVTARNTGTGIIVTAITNEAGAYNFPSLLPGTYQLSAELPGFQTQVINNVQLGGGVAARYNFTVQVGEVAQSVDVVAVASALLAETSASIGQVLPEEVVRDLPLVSNNVLDLMRTMAGVRGQGLGTSTTFAGISTQMVNTVRDGLSVQEGRYAQGVGSTTLMNPDLVSEFRVILTPVDAELGRGNGQVQILTRSGTNQYRGAAVWAIRNSAFDANTWNNNRQIVRGEWTPGVMNWVNRNQVTVSLGGPIVRNQTFFFALYDQQFERRRVSMRPQVLTACAQRGIFRYWEGWANGNINQVTSRTGANPAIQSVDSFGNPLRPETWPNGTPYTGELRYFSVFGPLLNTPTRPDCSDAAVVGPAWNALRPGMDPAGISQRYLELMPTPNIFDAGDGLNTAVHQWQRAGRNGGEFQIAGGTNVNTPRQQINLKIDHNFNSSHKIAGSLSQDWIAGDYIPSTTNPQIWPGGISSPIERHPRVFTLNLTSTLSPTVLNEFRFGYRANDHWVYAPWERPDELRAIPESLLMQGGQGYPIAYVPSPVGGMTANQFSCMTNCAQQGNRTPLTVIANSVSWTRGVHAFKGGGEYRTQYTQGSETPQAPIPKATGGAGLNPNQAFQNNPVMPGLVANNRNLADQLLYFLSGSVNTAQQYYYIVGPGDTEWSSYLDGTRKVTRADQNEFSFFFKDDWKLRPSFTLNLGVRYDWYGVPYEGNGLTPVPVDGALGLMGVSGRSFDRWMRTDNPIDLNLLSQIELVGPKTSQPKKSIFGNDWNNVSPVVGFAWQLPWLGRQTTMRGGYQISHVGGNNLSQIVNFIFVNQGFLNLAQTQGPVDGSYFSTKVLPELIPIAPTNTPLAPIPMIKPTQAGNAYDSHLRTPYIQNFTLSLMRELGRNLSTEIKYVGTVGLKLPGQYNLNTPNVFHNPELFEALEMTRRGENSPLFDRIFMGLNLNPGTRGCNPAEPTAFCAPVEGVTQRGSAHMRASATFRADLANGDYDSVASSLDYYNGTGSGPAGVVLGVPGERGTVLRRANENFPGQFPANWIRLNPQVSNANYYTNSGRSNYHSLQVQSTLRPTHGISFQGTYVWSRAMEVPSSGYTDPTLRELDYRVQNNHVTHDFRGFGTFRLPFGPGRAMLGSSSGVLARIVEGWQTSFLINLSTGQPATIGAADMLHGNGVPDVVDPSFSVSKGKVQWEGDFGDYFPGGTYAKVPDPQCAALATALQPYCSLKAVTDSSGKILLQNPQPGQRGTLGQRTISLPGQWAFDAAMSKSVRIDESKSLQIRVDATNVFNHPGPGNPSLNINADNPFGFIEAKDNDRRSFKGQIRLDF